MASSKGKRSRIIPTSQVLRKELLEQKLKTGSHEYVFGERVNKSSSHFYEHFQMVCKKANIKGMRFHDLRHTAATRMVESGVSIVAVSKILGHSDIKMTMRYAHPVDSLREAVEILGKFTNRTTNIATNDNP